MRIAANLCRVGEKFLEWVDDREPIPLDTILRMVTLYWFTSTFPRSIYPYRWFVREPDRSYSGFDEKPFGYSAYEKEVSNPPKAWTEKLLPKLIRYDHEKVSLTANLVALYFIEQITKLQ